MNALWCIQNEGGGRSSSRPWWYEAIELKNFDCAEIAKGKAMRESTNPTPEPIKLATARE